MKKLLVFLSVILLFFYGIAIAQDVTVSCDGEWNPGEVRTGFPVTWTISIFTSQYGGLMGSTNGFRVFLSSDGTPAGLLDPGPGFTPITFTTITDFSNYQFYEAGPRGVDGFGDDTCVFDGLSFNMPVVIDGPTWTISTQVEENSIGNYLCLDSTFVPPGDAWLWVVADDPWGGNSHGVIPSWDGPHCYEIVKCCQGNRGDVTGDDHIYVDDLVFLVNYVFKGGPAPSCLEAADLVIDGSILVDDLIALVRWVFIPHIPPPPCD